MKKILVLVLCISLIPVLYGCGHEHTWVEATCTAPRTCSKCGETEGEALGHNWTQATCIEPQTCTVCGETEGEPLGHNWVEATCTEPQTCTVCGETEGEPLGHDWTEATHETPKTCLRCGVTEGGVLLYTVSSSFTDGYEFAEFDRFNSFASENGLGGTMVWVEGTYDAVNTMDLPDVKIGLSSYYAFLKDTDGNTWFIKLDMNEYNPIEKYQDLCGHELLVLAEYNGFSKVYEAPSLFVQKMFDRNTGNMIVPAWYGTAH